MVTVCIAHHNGLAEKTRHPMLDRVAKRHTRERKNGGLHEHHLGGMTELGQCGTYRDAYEPIAGRVEAAGIEPASAAAPAERLQA